MGKLTINGHFNSYVKLPESKQTRGQEVDGVVHISSGCHIYKYQQIWRYKHSLQFVPSGKHTKNY